MKAHIDVGQLGFERKIDHHAAELDVAGAVYDEAGDTVAVIPGETSSLKLPLENFQAVRREGLLYEKAVALRPGRYLVKLVARDPSSGLLGNAAEWVEIPDRNARPLSLSAAFLKADNAPPAAGREPRARGRRRSRSASSEARGCTTSSTSTGRTPPPRLPADVVLQAQVWSGEKLVGVGPSHTVAFGGADAPPAAAGRTHCSRAGWAWAPSSCGFVAVDKSTGEKAVRRTPFTIQ